MLCSQFQCQTHHPYKFVLGLNGTTRKYLNLFRSHATHISYRVAYPTETLINNQSKQFKYSQSSFVVYQVLNCFITSYYYLEWFTNICSIPVFPSNKRTLNSSYGSHRLFNSNLLPHNYQFIYN